MQGLQCAVTEEKTLTAETVAALPGAGESVLDIAGSFAPGGVTLATGKPVCRALCRYKFAARTPTAAS